MKKLLAFLLCMCMVFVFAGCEELLMSNDSLDVSNIEPGKYTILVYMNGSDLESNYGMATSDLKEMMAAVYSRDDIRVVVQTGGASRWWNYNVPAQHPARYLVQENGIAHLGDVSAQSMGSAATLTDFINYGMQNFPADRYGLILWNHGGGSVYGYGSDELYNGDGMTLGELNGALKNSAAARQPFEFIGFDACLMASLETAWAVRDYGRYLVASEELEPGYGWDYTSWLTALGRDASMDGAALGRAIVDGFIAYYNNNGMQQEATTLSVVDLAKVGDAVTALEEFVAAADPEEYSYQDIARPRAGTREFGMPAEYGTHFDMVDIESMAQQYMGLCPDEATALIEAVKAAVVYKGQGYYVEDACGLSLYFPYSKADTSTARIEIYKTSGFSVDYINYVVSFASMLTGAVLAPLDDVGGYMPEQTGGEFGLTLTPYEISNMSYIFFTAWAHVTDDLYIQIYQDSNVQIDQSGQILTEFDGILSTLNGELACLYEIERGADYIRYAVPAVLNGQDVNIIVMMDSDNPDGQVLGALPVADEGGMAPRQMLPINDGDELALRYFCQEFADVGSEYADEDYEGPYWYEAGAFTVEGGLTLEHWEVPDGEYLYGFTIVDLQGNVYTTDYISLEYS